MFSGHPANPLNTRRISTRRQGPQHNQRLDIQPDVRVSTHPALHEPLPLDHAADPSLLAQGVAMLAAR